MTNPRTMSSKEAAREFEADEDEARWEEGLKKIAKARPEGLAGHGNDFALL